MRACLKVSVPLYDSLALDTVKYIVNQSEMQAYLLCAPFFCFSLTVFLMLFLRLGSRV